MAIKKAHTTYGDRMKSKGDKSNEARECNTLLVHLSKDESALCDYRHDFGIGLLHLAAEAMPEGNEWGWFETKSEVLLSPDEMLAFFLWKGEPAGLVETAKKVVSWGPNGRLYRDLIDRFRSARRAQRKLRLGVAMVVAGMGFLWVFASPFRGLLEPPTHAPQEASHSATSPLQFAPSPPEKPARKWVPCHSYPEVGASTNVLELEAGFSS